MSIWASNLTATTAQDAKHASISLRLRETGCRVWRSPSLMTWTSLAARTLGLVLLTPILMYKLPAAEVAVWLLFQSIISVQVLADFGFGITFSRAIAYTRAGIKNFIDIGKPLVDAAANSREQIAADSEPNEELLSDVVSSMRYIYRRLALIAVLLISVGGTIALWRPIQLTDAPRETWLAWAIIVLGTYHTFWAAFVVAYLQGLNRIATLRRWEALWSIAGTLSCALVALLGGQLLAVTVTFQLFAVAAILSNYRIASRVEGGLLQRVRVASLNREVFEFVWPAAWRSGIGVGLAIALMHHGPSLLYAQIADAQDTVGFLLAMRIMVAIAQLSTVPLVTSMPVIAREYAARNLDGVNAIAIKSMQRSYISFLVLVCTIGTGAKLLLQYLERGNEFISLDLWFLFAIGFFLERVGGAHLQLFSLSNRILWHIANGINGILFICLTASLWPLAGTAAFPWAMIASYSLFYTPFTMNLSYRLFGLKSWRVHEWNTFAIPVLLTLVFLAITLGAVV